jgi:hypothetical protein
MFDAEKASNFPGAPGGTCFVITIVSVVRLLGETGREGLSFGYTILL